MVNPTVRVDIPGNDPWWFAELGSNWIPEKLEEESRKELVILYLEKALEVAREMYGK